MAKSVLIKGNPFLLDPKKDIRICGYPPAGYTYGLGVRGMDRCTYDTYLHKAGGHNIFYLYNEYSVDEDENYKIISKDNLQATVLEWANTFSESEKTALKSIGIGLTEPEAHKLLEIAQTKVLDNGKSKQTAGESTTGSNKKQQTAIDFLLKARKSLLSQHSQQELLTILRQASSAITYLNRKQEFRWIENELDGYQTEFDLPSYRRVSWQNYSNLGAYLGEGQKPYTEPLASIINELNDSVQYIKHSANDFSYWVISKKSLNNIIVNVENKLLAVINTLLLEVEYDNTLVSIFDTIQARVDTKLVSVSENTLKELHHSYEELKQGSTQNWSAVASSCRRVIKDVADALYPASNITYKCRDGTVLEVKDDKVKNRLIAFVDAKTAKKPKLTTESINYFMDILSAIWTVASTGDHSEITREGAEKCLIYSYLVLGEVLNLQD